MVSLKGDAADALYYHSYRIDKKEPPADFNLRRYILTRIYLVFSLKYGKTLNV